MGDFDFSANLGVSQSRDGEVVEKHRDRGRALKDVGNAVSCRAISTRRKSFTYKMRVITSISERSQLRPGKHLPLRSHCDSWMPSNLVIKADGEVLNVKTSGPRRILFSDALVLNRKKVLVARTIPVSLMSASRSRLLRVVLSLFAKLVIVKGTSRPHSNYYPHFTIQSMP